LRFLQDGAYYQAKLSLQKAVEADLQYLPSRLRLAEALNELDYKDEARKQLTEIYRHSRDFADYTENDQLLLKAVHATIDNRFDEAIKYYSDIVRIASDSEKAQTYFDLGRAYEKYQQTDEAINQYKQVIALDAQSAAAHLHLGICYGVRLKELDNAENFFGQAEKLYQASGGFGLEGFTEVLFQRGTMYDGVNNLDKAREQLESARHQSMQLSNKYQYLKAVLQLSINSLYKGNYSQAQNEAEEAIKLARAERMDNLIPQGLIHLGSVFRRRRQYSEAESYFRQAEESARSYNGPYNIALAQSNLSSLYAELGTRLDEALREAEKAREFFKTAGYRGEELTVLLIIARAHRKLEH